MQRVVLHKNKIVGKIGEDIAIKYLETKGIVIVKRNFYCRAGEIDIIAKDKEELVFIEVKSRTNNKYGRPSEAVNYKKKKTFMPFYRILFIL